MIETLGIRPLKDSLYSLADDNQDSTNAIFDRG